VQREQIPLPLQWPVADRDEDFLVTEANRLAFTHFTRWSSWPVMATLLTGPRKSGRSLLAHIFVRKTPAACSTMPRRMTRRSCSRLERRAGAAPAACHDCRCAAAHLGDPPAGPRSRLAATPQVAIEQPDDELLAALILKLLSDRGIAVPAEVGDFLVPRIERSYVAVQNVVDTLDSEALAAAGD
jgi:chromosomal replication initiation ATPase DnaA